MITEYYLNEIKEIIQSGEKRTYLKKHLDAKERIKFSVLAHKNGLISLSTVDEDNVPCLCISPPLKEDVLDANFEFFSELVGKPVASMEDVNYFNLFPLYQVFVNNLSRCSVEGYKRFYKVFQDWLKENITNRVTYWTVMEQGVQPIQRINPPKARAKIVFTDENDGKEMVSVDIKSSVFQGYRAAGILKEDSWEEFITKHTDDPLFIKSKKLRLTVFGKCNQGRNNDILISNTIAPVWNKIVSSIPNAGESVVFLSGDEVVFAFADKADADSLREKFVSLSFPNYVSITQYRLERREIEQQRYFVRHFSFPKILQDIKAASPKIVNKAYKLLQVTAH